MPNLKRWGFYFVFITLAVCAFGLFHDHLSATTEVIGAVLVALVSIYVVTDSEGTKKKRRKPARSVSSNKRPKKQPESGATRAAQSKKAVPPVTHQDSLFEVTRPQRAQDSALGILPAPPDVAFRIPPEPVYGASASIPRVSPDDDGQAGDARESEGPLSALSVTSSRWMGKNEPVTVRGHLISGGFVYVGASLSPVSGGKVNEPALINPHLSVDRLNSASYHEKGLDYHPTYRDASPIARAAYLNWLSSGREDPDAAIGNVMLYFYGLERRVLHDAVVGDVPLDEVQDIVDEVKRLQRVYAAHPTFARQASDFLDFVFASDAPERTYESAPVPVELNFGVPFLYRLAMAQAAADSAWFPVEWALAWYWADIGIQKSTTTRRHPELFKRLFVAEYRARFGEGIPVPDTDDRLAIHYRPANVRFAHPLKLLEHRFDLPDPSQNESVLKCLESVGDACSAVLESYSRFIARNPDRAESPEAQLLLPTRFWPKSGLDFLEQCKVSIQAGTHGTAAVPLTALMQHLPLPADFTKSHFSVLLERLGEFGIGVEPDPRFGGSVPGAEAIVTLFGAPVIGAATVPDAYKSMHLELTLGVLVALADGALTEAEAAFLGETVDARSGLTSGHRARLKAIVQHFSREAPTMSGVKRKLEAYSPEQREALGSWLVCLAQIDAAVGPLEMRVLEKLFQALGIEAQTLYSLAHSILTSRLDPQLYPMSRAKAGQPPANPEGGSASTSTEAGGFSLDMSRVAQLRAETAQISSVLGAIFEDELSTAGASIPAEPAQNPGLSPAENSGKAGVWGLDERHSSLLVQLSEKSEWSRAEVSAICTQLSLMVDGALEKINEAAFERFDEPIVEGDDPLEINQSLILEIHS